jgi:dipeptidyl aminopeptidase/acylaminoacyl peptidase
MAQPPASTPNDDDIRQPLALSSWGAGDAQPSVVHFLNVRTATQPALSPDGGELAFGSAITGSRQVWTVAGSGGWPRQLTFVERVTFHRWSPRGDWILYGADTGGDGREGYFLVSPDGVRRRQLLAPSAAFNFIGGFSRDGSKIAYASMTDAASEIHVVNVDTGEDRTVFAGRPGLLADALRPDAGALVLTETRGEDANDLYLLDLTTGELAELFKPRTASAYESITWQPDGRGFYLATNEDREYKALARYDLASRKLEIVEAPNADVEQVALSHDGRLLAWVTNHGGYSRLDLRDLISGVDLTPPPLPPGVYTVHWAERAPVAAIAVSGPQVPGDIWIYDAEGDRLTRATESSMGGIDPASLPVPEPHSFASLDGVMIHGLLYRPKSAPPGSGSPIIVAVHGGPTYQARPDFAVPSQYLYKYLLSRGFVVFDLNYRGSTGYGKTYARLNDRRLREHELLDLEATVQWLADQPGVDGARVAIMGGSYGGYLTMAALGRMPRLFSAGVAMVGVANWLTALSGAPPLLKASDRIEYGDVDDPADREFLASLSPIAYTAQIRAPIMVIHGANDPIDPVAESDQFVRALRERDLAVEYLRFPDEGHDVAKLANRLIAYTRIAAFLERTLLPAR